MDKPDDNERRRHRRNRSRSRSPGRKEDKHRSRSKSKKHRRHKVRYSDDDNSSSSSTERHHSNSKKRHKKDSKKKHSKKHKQKKSRRSRSRSRSRSPYNESPSSTGPPGAHELANALAQLFDVYPAMTSLEQGGIPLMFIQLSRGTEFNLSSMPDRRLANLLNEVFLSLKVHGMELGDNGSWGWLTTSSKGSRRNHDALALLRLVRALLNGVGITMSAFGEYERKQRMEREQRQKVLQKQVEERDEQMKIVDAKETQQQSVNSETNNERTMEENEQEIMQRKRVERMTSQLLSRFDPQNTSNSALAGELKGICDLLLEGESVQLDGIENVKLKATMAKLFKLVGLELVEMDDEEDSEEDGYGEQTAGTDDVEKSFGYALPESISIRATVASNLDEVLRVCRFQSSDGKEGAPVAWAASKKEEAVQMESSSDEDEGPAPMGTIAAVNQSKRKRIMPVKNPSELVDEGGREEWMMVPGEHDFLKGIQAGGSKSTSSRTFKNEKNRGQSIAPVSFNAGPINPEVLAEVNAIQKAYEESRGPSLLDAHRQQQQDLKEQQQGRKAKDFQWSRDKNLDDGRRVDKNALHQVLGGASTELKSKFHGSHG